LRAGAVVTTVVAEEEEVLYLVKQLCLRAITESPLALAA
jgi:hypothetical protein